MRKFDISNADNRGITEEMLSEKGVTKDAILKPSFRVYLYANGYTDEDIDQMSTYELWLTFCVVMNSVSETRQSIQKVLTEVENAAEQDNGGLSIEDFEKIREQSNMSQRAFAEVFDIPFPTYAQWVSGRRNPPGYVLRMMANMLSMNKGTAMYTVADAVEHSVLTIFSGMDVEPDYATECPVYVKMGTKLINCEDRVYLVVGEVNPNDAAKLNLYLRSRHISPEEYEQHF